VKQSFNTADFVAPYVVFDIGVKSISAMSRYLLQEVTSCSSVGL